MSVTLFSIKINNFVKKINPAVDCSLYVDDILICYRSKNMNTVECQLQETFNNNKVYMQFLSVKNYVLTLDGIPTPVDTIHHQGIDWFYVPFDRLTDWID